MSSTNRSNARDKHKFDYYVTPIEPVQEFIKQFMQDEKIRDLSASYILDPCCWGDAKNDMTYPAALFFHGADYDKINTVDIREDSGAKIKGDFLKMSFGLLYDIIITNPAFNICQEIIEKSIGMVYEWWYVIMLLRLNYVGSKKRKEFWAKHKPYAIYAHSKRMSFTWDGGTDSAEYAHFVWRIWQNPDYAKFKII